MEGKVRLTVFGTLLFGILVTIFSSTDISRQSYDNVGLKTQVDHLFRAADYAEITRLLKENGMSFLDNPLLLNVAIYAVVQENEELALVLQASSTPQYMIAYAKFLFFLYQGNIPSAMVALHSIQSHKYWIIAGELEKSRFTDRPKEMQDLIATLSRLPISESTYWLDDAINYYALNYHYAVAEYEKCWPIIRLEWRYEYIKDDCALIAADILATKKEIGASLELINANIQSRGLSGVLAESKAVLLYKKYGAKGAAKFLENVQINNRLFTPILGADFIWSRYLSNQINEANVIQEMQSLSKQNPSKIQLYFEKVHMNIFFKRYTEAQILLGNLRLHFKEMSPLALFEEAYLQAVVEDSTGVGNVLLDSLLQQNPMHRDVNWLIINTSDHSKERFKAFERLLQIDAYDQFALLEMSKEYWRKNQHKKAIQVACKIFKSDRVVSKSMSAKVMAIIEDAQYCFPESSRPRVKSIGVNSIDLSGNKGVGSLLSHIIKTHNSNLN